MAKIGSLEPLLASKRITDSPFIKGGYFPIDKLSDLENMRVATDTRDGTIVHGSLCYCREDDKFYQYNGESWVVVDAVPRMSEVDNIEAEDNPDRPFSRELYNDLVDKSRAYVERPKFLGGGVSPNFYLDHNVTKKLFEPYGYNSLEDMEADMEWGLSTVTEGEHYKAITHDDGSVSYHPRLQAIALKALSGNLRTGDPVDSTDAVPYGRFKKYTFENAEIKNYQVVRRGSTGQLYSTAVDTKPSSETFALRTKDKELLSDVTDSSPENACVNKEFLTSKLTEYAKPADVEVIVTDTIAKCLADAPEDFDTLKEMSDWIYNHSGSAAEMNSAIIANTAALENKADKNDIPTTLPASDVFNWAKEPDPPTYTASDVGALPDTTVIPTVPTNVSEFNNDAKYITKDDIPSLDDYAKTADFKISGKVINEIGGISANTIYDNESVADILRALLFPYVAPSEPTLSIYTESGELVEATYSTERKITVKKASISFTAGSEPITSVKIYTSNDGGTTVADVLYEATSASNGAMVSFDDNKSVIYEEGNGGTIYCTTSDGTEEGTFTTSFSVSFPYTAPSGLSLKIYDTNSVEFVGSRPYGDTTPAKKAKISFTAGSKPIKSVKIGRAQGDDYYYSSSSATSDVFDLTNEIPFTGENANKIYYCISDGTTEGTLYEELTVDVNYIAPSFIFSIYNTDNEKVSGKNRYGKKHYVNKAKIELTVEPSRSVVLVKIGTTEGGDDLYWGTSIPSDGVVTFKDNQSVCFDGENEKTIYCEVYDDRETVKRYVWVFYEHYCYAAVTQSATPPNVFGDGCSVVGDSYSASKELTNRDSYYVWLLVPKDQISGDMVIMKDDVPIYTKREEVASFDVGVGATTDYYAYRTDLLSATTAKYKLGSFEDNNNYVAVTTGTDNTNKPIPPASVNNATPLNGDVATLNTSSRSYVWFLMKNTDKPYIHIYSMGDKWRYVETIYEGTVELETGVGIKVSRYAYRTTPRAAATDVQCCVYSTIQNT